MTSFWSIVAVIAISSLFSWFRKKIGAWEQEWPQEQEEPTLTDKPTQYSPSPRVEPPRMEPSRMESPRMESPRMEPSREALYGTPSPDTLSACPLTMPPVSSTGNKVSPMVGKWRGPERSGSDFTLFDEAETEAERIHFLRRAIVMGEILDRKY